MDPGMEEEPCNLHMVRIVMPDEKINIGELCGDNNGQHLYIQLETKDRGYGQDSVRIELEFAGERKRYQYNIKVEQLDYTEREDIKRMAPTGCQQYFTGNETRQFFSLLHLRGRGGGGGEDVQFRAQW